MRQVLVLFATLVLAATSADACSRLTVEPRYLTHQMDGDTISLFTFPQGQFKFRVADVNTPERGEPGWAEARAFTWAWLNQGPFTIETCWKRTLDRYVAVISRDGVTLAEALTQQFGYETP